MDDEDRNANGSGGGGGRESVSITEMEACLDNGNAFNRLEVFNQHWVQILTN